MRGSGKSTVAAILKQKTGLPHIEQDALIEEAAGMPISEMVREHGWEYFRDKETNFLKALKPKNLHILSSGGGAPVREENREILRELGVVFYLATSPETSAKRIGGFDHQRPSLTGDDSLLADLKKTFEEREFIYEETAHYAVSTEQITPEQVADTILAYMELP